MQGNKQRDDATKAMESIFKEALRAHQQGDTASAEAGYRKVLAARPEHVGALHMLATLEIAREDLDAAQRRLRQAIGLKPSWALHYDLGYVMDVLGRPDEAEREYRRAIELNPQCLDAHYNLGILLKERNRPEEAARAYQAALAIDPDHAPARNNLGLALSAMQQPAKAARQYEIALRLRPDHPETLNNLGMALFDMDEYARAREVFRRVVALQPEHGHAASKLYHLGQQLCDWQGQEENLARVASLLERGSSAPVAPFDVLAGALTPAQLRELGRGHGQYACRGVIQAPALVPPGHRHAHARTRIGYLSGDITHHPVTLLLAGVLEQHDRAGFDARVYSYGPDRGDTVRARVRAGVEVFTDVSALTDAGIAARIAADEVDILVDLTGYTQHGRPGIGARRPAPVIVSWLGYPGSLGHERMADYIIGDPVLTPLSQAEHYSETLALMPHCYQPTDASQPIGPTPTRAEAGLPDTGVVFCSFNQAYKLNAEMFDVWCRLLRAVPGSVLWLLRPRPEAEANLRRETEARGVSPERLVFADKMPLAEHLGRLRLADLALDTYPYGSGATGSNTLWAGVPMVTRIGATYVSRMAASQLHAIGLDELVTDSAEAYFELARALALDPDRLRVLRERLWRNRTTQPLFDTTRFTRDLERLYAAMLAPARGEGRHPIVLDPSEASAPARVVTPASAAPPSVTVPSHELAGAAQAHYMQGMRAHREGRLDAAESEYRQALEMTPDNPDALHMLAVLHGQRGRPEQAEAHFRAALEVADRELFWRNYAKFLVQHGRLGEAEAAYNSGLRCEPGNARCMQGLVELRQKRAGAAPPPPALEPVKAAPESAETHETRGIALHRQGDLAGAEQAFRQALAIDPGLGRAWYNLGCILQAADRLDEAEASLMRAVELRPNMSNQHNNLGMVQFELGKDRLAEQNYREAVRLDPKNINAWINLGGLQVVEGRFAEATEAMRRALELDPGNAHFLSSLLHYSGQVHAWREHADWNKRLARALARQPGDVHSLFTLLALPSVDAVLQRRVARAAMEARLGDALTAAPRVPTSKRYGHARPRIGYLSGDIFHHPVTLLIAGVLEHHDRAKYDIRVYSYWPAKGDALHASVRARVSAAVEQFTDLSGASDDEIAARIAADEVDILIDLTGYTQHGRPGITAQRPAPIIVNWLGYPGSLGHERLADYIIGDPVLTPLSQAEHYSETLALMPHCYQPTDASQAIGPTPTRAELGLPETGIVFCSFNQPYKLTAHMFGVWCRLLREVPGSVLWLLGQSQDAEANLRREAEARGVAPERLVFADKVSLDAHLGRLACADLALDTYPYGSGATGSNALWAGVPLITRRGETYVSRMAASQLHAIGLDELVTDDDEGYVQLARALALDNERRQALRQRLWQDRLTRPLFDTARYTRDLERLYTEMLRAGARQPIVLAADAT